MPYYWAKAGWGMRERAQFLSAQKARGKTVALGKGYVQADGARLRARRLPLPSTRCSSDIALCWARRKSETPRHGALRHRLRLGWSCFTIAVRHFRGQRCDTNKPRRRVRSFYGSSYR